MKHKRPEQPPVNSPRNPMPPRDKEEEKRMKQHERELRREHRKARRWRYVCSVLIILLALLIIALLLCMLFDVNPFGKGNGNDNGGVSEIISTVFGGSSGDKNSNTDNTTPTAAPVPTEEVQPEPENNGPQTITIRIDSDRIYVGDAQCEDAEDMKEKIIRLNYTDCLFVLDASKGTVKRYDEVRTVLDSLEDALGIKITEINN